MLEPNDDTQFEPMPMPVAEYDLKLKRELLMKDLDLLRARLDILKRQTATVARSGASWAHGSARAQLGPYPWAKLAAITGGSFLVVYLLRRPAAALTTSLLPLLPVIAAKIVERKTYHG